MNDIFEKRITFGLEIDNEKYYGKLKIDCKSFKINLYKKSGDLIEIYCHGSNLMFNNNNLITRIYFTPTITINRWIKFYINYNEKDNIKIQINNDNTIELPINKKLHVEADYVIRKYSKDYDIDAYLKEYIIVDNDNYKHLISNLIIDLNYEVDDSAETKRIIINDNAKEFLFTLNQFFIEWNQYKGAIDNTTKYYVNREGDNLNE